MTMREVVEKLAEAVDNMSIDRACEYCRVEGWPETEQAIALSLAEADRLDAELAAAKARNDKLSRALGTTCWQCEKCGEVRDSRPCVYCELAALKAVVEQKHPGLCMAMREAEQERDALKAEKATAAEAWDSFRKGNVLRGDDLDRYFGRE